MKYFYHSPATRLVTVTNRFALDTKNTMYQIDSEKFSMSNHPRVTVMGLMKDGIMEFTVSRYSETEKKPFCKLDGRTVCEDRMSKGIIVDTVKISNTEKPGDEFYSNAKILANKYINKYRS